MSTHILILAAGQGKRMASKTPKVLQLLGGKAMLSHVLDTALSLNPECIHVVYGHEGERILAAMHAYDVHWVHQAEQLGTGHAVLQALAFLPDEAQLLILSGDVPLITQSTLEQLIQSNQNNTLTLLTAKPENPKGLGRIQRNQMGLVTKIIEEKDANSEEKNIQEIYTGMCAVQTAALKRWLPKLSCDNAQKEYYLTDIIQMAYAEGQNIQTVLLEDLLEAQGVNDRLQLEQLERAYQRKQAERLLAQGVAIADSRRFDLRGKLSCGQDVFIDVGCVFEGDVILSDDCIIEPYSILKNVHLGAGTVIHAHSVLEGCRIGNNCHIGPFARLREGTLLADHCKIGNFVETKKITMDMGSKASHLSYLGDATIGKKVNIGAGTITCNYDGANKHQTIIEDEAFIGSDTQLIAPVTVGRGATIGAGTSLRKNAPKDALTVSMTTQKTLEQWKRPKK